MKYYEEDYGVNRLGVRYKTCKKCREKKHKCTYEGCDKSFKDKGHLNRHIRTVHEGDKPHECEICNKTFGQKGYLDTHIRTVHEDDKPYECKICNKSFGHKGCLGRHIRNVHEDDKPHECNICNKFFGHKGTLITHIRTVHENIKPFECKICNKSFGLKKCLDTHIRTVHEGDKPYECDVCNKSFGQKGNLDTHIRTVHEGDKPYECKICNKCFGEKGTFNKHKKICTGESNLSHGEYTVEQYLLRNNIQFIYNGSHYNLKSYKNKGLLRFDFILPMDKYGFYCFIEFDGKHHYHPVCFGGISQERAEENFKRQQENDRLKDEYCDENHFPLLRIKYDCTKTENIEQKVEEFLKQYLNF
jgi:uncharacterized Zn-finger protein